MRMSVAMFGSREGLSSGGCRVRSSIEASRGGHFNVELAILVQQTPFTWC